MSIKDSLGDRMKGYENVSQINLIRRTPVIIRLDGKAFHTYTKKIIRTCNTTLNPQDQTQPFNFVLHAAMTTAAFECIKNIQNAKIAYTQSDEISILLTDWNKLTTQQWFNANVQKITSVAASICTAWFNQKIQSSFDISPKDLTDYLAYFDCRVFNIPFNEVTNYFIWRQQDAMRNSINMLARTFFSDKELYKKSTTDIQDMLLQINVNWNDLFTWQKRGTCITTNGSSPVIDEEPPIFTQERQFIEQYLTDT